MVVGYGEDQPVALTLCRGGREQPAKVLDFEGMNVLKQSKNWTKLYFVQSPFLPWRNLPEKG